MDTNKSKYKEFCDNNDIPIFSQYWWLDAVCGSNNWDVILVEKNGEILASMPYHFKKKYFFKVILMPMLSQNMGIFFKYGKNFSYKKKLIFEEECFNKILSQLPSTSLFFQKFHYSITNWLPMYWHNYRQTTNYTYIIKNIKDIDNVLANFSKLKWKEVKRANRDNIKITFDVGVDEFYEHHRNTLKSQGKSISYPKDILKNIVENTQELNKGRILAMRDSSGELLSCMLVVWDTKSAYSLISSISNKCRERRITAFLFYEAIKYASKYVDIFDFEGSMIKGVAHSFRHFGAIQTPYFKITKANNIFFKILWLIKEL